jgi:hypothetical protein
MEPLKKFFFQGGSPPSSGILLETGVDEGAI